MTRYLKQCWLISLLSIPMPILSTGCYDRTDITIILSLAATGLCTFSFVAGLYYFAKQKKDLLTKNETLHAKIQALQNANQRLSKKNTLLTIITRRQNEQISLANQQALLALRQASIPNELFESETYSI